MERISIFVILILFISCDGVDQIYTPEEISPCIQELMDDFAQTQANNKDAKIIRYSTESGNAYLLTDGSELMDGGNPIVNNNCVAICHTCGECFQPKCIEKLLSLGEENVQLLWPK